ncbi:MAG: hypothetical protein ACOCVY_03090 [Patescibacteria group bacterium]
MKNFKIKGITEHAISQALSKGAPILRPKKLKNLKKRGEVKIGPAAGGRVAFIYLNNFVYVADAKKTVIITVLTWREYKNIMYS